jgi:hypothetical protein
VAMTDVFARCSKKIAAQVCAKYMITKRILKEKRKQKCHELPALYLLGFDHVILDYSIFIFPNLFLLIVYFSAG